MPLLADVFETTTRAISKDNDLRTSLHNGNNVLGHLGSSKNASRTYYIIPLRFSQLNERLKRILVPEKALIGNSPVRNTTKPKFCGENLRCPSDIVIKAVEESTKISRKWVGTIVLQEVGEHFQV